MLQSKVLSCCLLIAVGLGHAKAAGEMEPYDPVQNFAPSSINFDDRVGRGFDWSKNLPCGANRATVTVKFDRAYASRLGMMLPVAKVWLHSGSAGTASEQWIAAVVKAPTDIYRLNAQAWLEKVSSSAAIGPGYAPADLTKPMQIELAWTRDGVVSVSFGGEYVKRITTDRPITSIGLGGSWAKFEFIDLKVGHSGAISPECTAIASVARP